MKVDEVQQLFPTIKGKRMEELREAWSDIDEFNQVGALVRDARKRIKSLCGRKSGAYLERAFREIDSAMKSVQNELKTMQPYTCCRTCGGSGCNQCRQTGWIPKGVYDLTPDEVRNREITEVLTDEVILERASLQTNYGTYSAFVEKLRVDHPELLRMVATGEKTLLELKDEFDANAKQATKSKASQRNGAKLSTKAKAPAKRKAKR